MKKAFQAGNYKDAYDGLRKLALDPNDDPRQVGEDLTWPSSLRNLGRVDEIDEFREAVDRGPHRELAAAGSGGRSTSRLEHYGFIVAGKFYRGNHRGGGRWSTRPSATASAPCS